MTSADATADSDAQLAERAKFQGTWRQIAYQRDGIEEPLDEQGWEPQVTFAGDEFVVTLADGRVWIKGTFTLHPIQEPRAVDWNDTFGEDAGKTLLAIYAFEGDRLIFCAANPGEQRPTAFTTRAGQVLRVHQRVAPAAV